MYEPTISDVLRGLFGRGWRQAAPDAMGYGERQIMRIRAGTRRASHRSLQRLKRAAGRLHGQLEYWRRGELQRVEEKYRQRQMEIAGAMTALNLVILDHEKRDAEEKRKRANWRLVRRAKRSAAHGV
jgi:hypothetical protein